MLNYEGGEDMDYEQLGDTLKYALPMNRKERFYTGTVLPSLLFHNGFSNLYRFLEAIPGFPKEVNEKTTGDRFLFYTEYNLKESAGKRNVGVEILAETNETPDVVMHILHPAELFVVIEAKMFQRLTQDVFNTQMRAQKEAVINRLEDQYHPESIFHVALLPSTLGFQDTDDYTVVNWEFFVDNRALDVQANYFYPYLKFALRNYKALRSKVSAIHRIPGSAIFNEGNPDTNLWVGRSGGKDVIQEDVRSGKWKRMLYAVSSGEGPPRGGRKGNWLRSEEFATVVANSLSASQGHLTPKEVS